MIKQFRSVLLSLSCCFALALLTHCGGSSSPPTTPTTPTTPTPAPPCTQTSVFGPASGSIPSKVVVVESFTTNAAGRVDVLVDWTFNASPIGVYVVQGSCNLDQFNARTCNFLLRSEPPGAKPRKVSASNVAPGTYGLLIANFAEVEESVSTQVVLSSASCPAQAATASSGAALDQARGQISGISQHLD